MTRPETPTAHRPPRPLTHRTLLAAVGELAARDPVLAAVVQRHGPPPLWARPRGFATLVRIVLEQQVSLASAAALHARLSAALAGGVTPGGVLAAGPAGLRALGVTRQKAGYLHGIAERVTSGALPLEALSRLGDAEAAARLIEVPGVGPWTAAIYLLMALRRPDVWPPGDLALHKAMARVEGMTTLPRSDEAAAHAERWRPWRAVAARMLWHEYLGGRPA